MKKFFLALTTAIVLVACGNDKTAKDPNDTTNVESVDNGNTKDAVSSTTTEATTPEGNPSYDPNRGEGKWTEVKFDPKLNQTMAKNGENEFNTKCSSCHKLSDEKLVGPGWKGVSERHKPEWIMNFITNPDAMIDKDPKLQAQLEICLVRMPNQNLDDEHARSLLEFMRKNDGVK